MDERWDDLVEDLEGQALARAEAERRAHDAELRRADAASVSLAARVRSLAGHVAVVTARGAGTVRGTVVASGPTWLVLEDARTHVVRLGAVLSVQPIAPDQVAEQRDSRPPSAVESRWGLGGVLRPHADERRPVTVILETGESMTGRLVMVGADHIELVGDGRERRWVPFAAVATVVTDGAG